MIRAMAAAGAAALIYAAGLVAAGLLSRPRQADLAVILGSQVLPGGQPSPRLAARLNAGAAAYHAGLVPLLLVSGGREPDGQDEADAMRAYLTRGGVPAAAILEDHDGVNTRATARDTAALMQARGLSSVLVISQYFHLPRCRLAFHQAGIAAVASAYPWYFEWRDVYAVAREMAALPAYALRP